MFKIKYIEKELNTINSFYFNSKTLKNNCLDLLTQKNIISGYTKSIKNPSLILFVYNKQTARVFYL